MLDKYHLSRYVQLINLITLKVKIMLNQIIKSISLIALKVKIMLNQIVKRNTSLRGFKGLAP